MEGDQQHQGVRMGRGRALQMRLRKEKEERERRRKQQEEEEEKDGKEQQRLGAVPKQPGERSVGAVGGSSDLESLSQNMASLRTDGDSKLSARERILKFRAERAAAAAARSSSSSSSSTKGGGGKSGSSSVKATESSCSDDEGIGKLDFSSTFGSSDEKEDLTRVATTPLSMATTTGSAVEKEPATGLSAKGASGSRIRLETNYVRLKRLDGGRGFFSYEVRFCPALDHTLARFKAIHSLAEVLGKDRNFDGASMLHLPFKLDQDVTVLTAHLPPPLPTSVQVTLRFKSEESFGGERAVDLYNKLFKQISRRLKMVQMRKGFFDPKRANVISKYKLEIWPGYVTTVCEKEGGLLLNCDISHRVLRCSTVLQLIADVCQDVGVKNGGSGGARIRNMQDQVTRQVVGETVLTRYNNKFYRVDDIDWNATPMSTFVNSQGQEITYWDYYRNQYGKVIGDKEQCMLVSMPRKRNEEDPNRQLYLVPELCNLTGLSEHQRKDYAFMRTVASVTRTTPRDRSIAIQKFVTAVKENEECRAVLAAWGLELESAALEVEGRVLDPVKIRWGRNQAELVDSDIKMRDKIMLRAKSVEDWIIVFQEKDSRAAKFFANSLQKEAEKIGMTVANPEPLSVSNDRTESYVRCIESVLTARCHLDLVVVVFPSKRSDRYAAVKKLCYTKYGVACQVVLATTLQRGSDQTKRNIVEKIGIQINAKLGGEPWGSLSPFKNAMIVGIDVYHNPDKKSSSWCGFVASLNRDLSKWASFTAEQRPHVELVDSMKQMFIRSLETYVSHNGTLPDKVIIYRDGVGDGRMEHTRRHELGPLKEAVFKDFESDGGAPYRPQVSMVIVSKRISTRLLAIGAKGEKVNPPPGTAVDHTITGTSYDNFFLVSQNVNHGTVVPTHYVCLEDEVGLGQDKLQKLTYKLTYMYYNWAGPVRVPAPCMYAHKVAGIAGEYLKREPHRKHVDRLFYL